MDFTDLPQDLVGLALIVFLLGARHGLDADHLAAIDGLARSNARDRPRLARMAGMLFSLGHGVVVVAIALAVSIATIEWHTPHWLEAFGAWTSITILLMLALINIVSVLKAPSNQVTRLFGWRSGVFARWLSAGSPWTIAGVGTLFALSFDTVSQAVLFAVTATPHGGWRSALFLALLFLGGMLVVDGINGLWMAKLMVKADRTALVASRTMGLAVSGVSLLVAAVGVAGQTLSDSKSRLADNQLWFAAAIGTVVVVSYFIGQWLVRVRRTEPVA
jgi:high-affinity nickel-transport protein